MKGASYCILNKQYTKEEYEELAPRIIQQMSNDEWRMTNAGAAPLSPSSDSGSSRFLERSEGNNVPQAVANKGGRGDLVFGEFFPPSLSPFGYDQTIANEYYPLSAEQAREQGFGWMGEQTPTSAHHGASVDIPSDITQVNDDIIKQVLSCASCSKSYKIIAQELRFYREANLPIPKTCFHCRHLARMALRNPRFLHNRTCMKCSAPITTTYAPDRKETVYCGNVIRNRCTEQRSAIS